MKNIQDFYYAKEAIMCSDQIQANWHFYWLVHEEFIVYTAVCQKAPLRL